MKEMDLSILSANLRRLRAAKGMSQGELAEAAQLSRVGYRNIESGASAPRVDSLLRVAVALDVPLAQLLASVRSMTAVRFRAEKKMTTRGELLIDVARWLDDYNKIEEIVGQRAKFKLAELRAKLAGTNRGEPRAIKAAALAREHMGLKERDIVHNLCGLLEQHGVKVFTPKLASEKFFGLSIAESGGGPAVVVNVWERLSVERWIFTAAHELGHLLLHLDSYDVCKTEEDLAQEKEADVFASQFLMPDALFNRQLEEARGLPLVKLVLKLKRVFRVSWKSVLCRIASQTKGSGKLWGKFRNEYRALSGRTLGKTGERDGLSAGDYRSVRPSAKVADEPEHLLKDDFVEARLSRLVRRAVESDEISIGRAAEVLGLELAAMREFVNSWV